MRTAFSRLALSIVMATSCLVAVAAAPVAASRLEVRPAAAQADQTLGTNIANLAYAQLSKHACDRNSLGGTGFIVNSFSSCRLAGYSYAPNWCWVFTGWVWSKSGVVTTGLNSVAAYEKYKHPKTGTPHVGDVVIFYQLNAMGTVVPDSHIAIVYRVNSGGTVTTVGGNEDNVWVWLRTFPSAVGSYSGNVPTGYVSGYVTP
jgi:hypothetical protein